MSDLTAESLKKLLRYDPETGAFNWVRAKGKRRDLDGRPAGSNQNGYTYIRVNYFNYPAHRLAWLYMTGAWPSHEIDHKNLVKNDNRWQNLRSATHAENLRNLPLNRRSTSGIRGVSFCKYTKRWRAHITINRKMITIGRFDDRADAAAARLEAERGLYGEFARAA
jgi:hypothetical protein